MTTSDPATLLAETRAFNEELESLLATIPPVNTVPPEESRRARREGRGIFPAPVYVPEARVIEIDGPAGPIPLRIIAPEGQARGMFLHFHGGGWTLGEADGQDVRLQRLARETGLTVVSVDYRLAPENPYPAGPDDCEAAAVWLLSDEAQTLIGATGPRAVGGDSAGGQLAAVTLLRLRDRHGIMGAYGAAVLQYGGFDLSMSPSQRLWGDRNLVLSTPIIALVRRPVRARAHARSSAETRTSRRCSPISRECRRRSSRSAPRMPCSTTRCSWRRGGARRVTSRSCGSGPRRRTDSCRCR